MDGSSTGLDSASKPLDVPWFLRSRTRLFATLFLVVALPFGAFSLDVALNVRKTLETQAILQNTAAARLGAAAVEGLFEGLVLYVESYTRRPELVAALEDADAGAVRSHLRDLVQGNKHLGRVFITDPNGVERFDWPADPNVIGKSFAYRDWYKGVTREGRAYVSEVYLRAAEPRCDVVAIAVPVHAGEGRLLGYLVAQNTIEALRERLAAIRPAGGGAITLIDSRGHPVVERVDPKTEPDDLSALPLVRQMLATDEVSVFASDPLGGEPSLLSSVRAAHGWIVVAREPSATVYAPAKTLQSSIFLLALLWMVGMLGLGFVWLNVVRRHHIALLELQRQKDALSGMIIHDLRNPVAATLGSLDLVRAHSQEMEPLLRDDVARASHSARRVRELLNTLLDVMRMEEGVLEVKPVRQDLVALVRSKVDEYRPLAQAASLTIDEVFPDHAVEASVDSNLFGRVLENLIINAIHHTPRGGRIEIGLAPRPKEGTLILSVSDTGEGIPREALPFLFKKFFRVGEQEMGRPHDVGLGLVFCKMAVEMHHGKIEVESEPGGGTVFRVGLPMLLS